MAIRPELPLQGATGGGIRSDLQLIHVLCKPFQKRSALRKVTAGAA